MPRSSLKPLALAHERRAFPRGPVSISARLELPSGGRPVQIIDLTERGARLRMSDPPPAGAPALLKWHPHECYCAVIWSDDDGCGLLFEQLLPDAVLSDCFAIKAGRPKPAAALDNIRAGARRGANPSRTPIFGDGARAGYAWSVALRRPIGADLHGQKPMSPAEEMFFYGSPLAHLVDYEEELWRRRRDRCSA